MLTHATPNWRFRTQQRCGDTVIRSEAKNSRIAVTSLAIALMFGAAAFADTPTQDKQPPDPADRLLESAEYSEKLGDWWKAHKSYTQILEQHPKSRLVQLANRDVPQVELNDNPDFAIGRSNIPYQKEITWYGRLEDLYLVNVKDGKRKKIASKLEDRSSLSPNGRYVVYFHEKHWYLFDGKSGNTLNLTEKLEVPFYDEDTIIRGWPPATDQQDGGRMMNLS